jgi:hypothetical protein
MPVQEGPNCRPDERLKSYSVKKQQVITKYGSERMLKPKTTISGRFGNSSGGWIRTNDLRVMSQKPESVLFVRRAMYFSQTGERWFLLARHAAIVDRYAYSSVFTWVRQVLFPDFIFQLFQFVCAKHR